MYSQYINNPKGFCNERRFVMKYAPTIKLKFEAAVHYVAESMIAKDSCYIQNSTNKLCTIFATPAGFLLYLLIKGKTKAKR